MGVSFASPLGALLAIGVILPLASFALVERRARRIRAALGLRTTDPSAAFFLPVAAVVAVVALLAVAASQPVVRLTTERLARSDAEAIVVLDTSRSMLAAESASSPTRLSRAKSAARELRAELPEVPVGLTSLTDRALPHLSPTIDEDAFEATVSRSIGIERPPPVSGRNVQISTLGALAAIPTDNFFTPRASRRVLIVLSDAESLPFAGAGFAVPFRRAPGVRTIVVRIGHAGERVFGPDGQPEAAYRPDPLSAASASSLAVAGRGRAFGESQLDEAASTARRMLGEGPTVSQGKEHGAVVLAPYFAAGAFLPLLALLFGRRR